MTLKSSEELVIIHEQYYVIIMHCWFVLFVMEGVSGAEGEREVDFSGKDYSKSISKLQCNQTNITHSSTDFNTILIKLNYS